MVIAVRGGLKTSLQSKTDAIAVMTLLKTMTFRTVLFSKDNNDFHDILVTLVTKWEDMELNNIYHIRHRLDCEEMNLLWPNDSIILTLYYIYFIRKNNFCQNIFWLNA